MSVILLSLSVSSCRQEESALVPLSVELLSEDPAVTVTNDGKAAVVEFGPDGGTVSVTVSTVSEWEWDADGLEDWCDVYQAGKGLSVHCGPLEENALMEGMVIIRIGGKEAAYLRIHQQGLGSDPVIFLESNEINLYDNGGLTELRVLTNMDTWDVAAVSEDGGSLSWLTVSKSEPGNAVLIDCEQNTDTVSRSAVIKVTGMDSDGETVESTVHLSQWEASMVFEVTVEAGETVALPFKGNVDLTVAWDDNVFETMDYSLEIAGASQYITKTYETAGVYHVRVVGSAETMSYETYEDDNWPGYMSESMTLPLTGLLQWGDLGITSMRSAFAYSGLSYVTPDTYGRLKGVRNMKRMFLGCASLTEIPEELFYAAVDAETFSEVFNECTGLTQIPGDLFSRNTRADDFSRAFAASGVTSVPENLFAANTEAVTFSGVFQNCAGLKSVPAGIFSRNTGAEDLSYAFAGTALTAIPEGIFTANNSLKSVAGCFSGLSIASIPDNLLTGKTSLVDASSLFSDCAELQSIPENMLSGLTGLENIADIFNGCSSLTSVPEDLFKDCGNVRYAERLFIFCSGLKSIPQNLLRPFVKAETMESIFNGCTGLQSIPEGLFSDCAALTNLENGFNGCVSLTAVPGNLFPSSILELGSCFCECSSLREISPEAFKGLDKVSILSYVFQYCTSLRSLPEGLFADCASCSDYSYAFGGCSALESLPADLLNGKSVTESYTGLRYIFKGCTSLKTLPEDLFSTFTGTQNMEYVFTECTGLESIPDGLLRNCTALSTANGMFQGCSGLKDVPAGIFDSCVKLEYIMDIFSGCSSVACESPYTVVDGQKVHLYERMPENGFTEVYMYMRAFENASFTDMESIPESWK